ncbi:hypothetical protein, partial [Clostridium neonatale]|uniref:hypothetical protein n=1 Tax=Clostridium neonatale TaxID=137838 RepID=UPI00397E7161
VSFGSLIAPKNSALAARYLLTLSCFFYIVAEDVIKAITPPFVYFFIVFGDKKFVFKDSSVKKSLRNIVDKLYK